MITNIQTQAELEYQLLMEMGLGVDSNFNLIDQDFGTQIFFNSKNVKVIVNGVQPQLNMKTDILFDPLNNVQLMRNLFQYYIKKLESEGTVFTVYYPVQGHIQGQAKVEIKDTQLMPYSSKYYFNECLRYIDLIMVLNEDENVDLTMFDARIVR